MIPLKSSEYYLKKEINKRITYIVKIKKRCICPICKSKMIKHGSFRRIILDANREKTIYIIPQLCCKELIYINIIGHI